MESNGKRVDRNGEKLAFDSAPVTWGGLGTNAHVIVFCEPEMIEKFRENIRSILNYYGGVAYISEATKM